MEPRTRSLVLAIRMLACLLFAAVGAPPLAVGAPTVALVRDIRAGPSGSRPNALVAIGDRLCFLADDGVHQTEWWTTRGTAESTQLVADLDHGYLHVPPTNRALMNGVLYFAPDGSDRAEPYRTDCTRDGTSLLEDLRPGLAGSAPAAFTRVGDRVFFVASDRPNTWQLYATDGTPEGTVAVFDTRPEVAPGPVEVQASGPLSARQRRALEETVSSAEPLDPNRPRELFALGERVVFFFDDGTHGPEPWVSDGTPGGTHVLKETRPGGDSILPTRPLAAGGVLYFFSTLSRPALELWATDGTEASTRRVALLPEGSELGWQRAGQGGGIVFDLKTSGASKMALWTSDGTEGGTQSRRPEAATVFPGRASHATRPGVRLPQRARARDGREWRTQRIRARTYPRRRGRKTGTTM